jgi:NitT/TauT family transport system permease protein
LVIYIAASILYSWVRLFLALLLSIGFSLAVGILAARNKRAETVIIPLLDVFQSIPILGFFPFVLFGIIAILPGQPGVNLAIIVLIFTSMSWNITFGVYEAVRSIPQDYIDLSQMAGSSSWERIRTLYIPSSLSRIAYNTQTSWAVGLFYLISSEIISVGGKTTEASLGIGVAISQYSSLPSTFNDYIYSIIGLVIAVIIWQFVFLREFSIWSEKYKFVEEPRGQKKDPLLRFYSWVNQRSISKLFLIRQGRGVSRFTSSITRFKRGFKYAIVILILIFLAFEIGSLFFTGHANLSNLPSAATIFGDEANVALALAFSFLRVWYVFFICIAVSVPAGIALGLRGRLYDVAIPILEVVASVPAPALLPLFVKVTNSGEAIAAIVIFLGMIWYVIFNVMAGIRSLPAEIFELNKEFRVSTLTAWRNVYLPAIASAFVTGAITAIGAAWNTLIVAEYFTTTSPNGQTVLLTQVGTGIGKTIYVATLDDNLLILTLSIISMTVLIVGFNLTVWRRVYHYVTRRYTYNR